MDCPEIDELAAKHGDEIIGKIVDEITELMIAEISGDEAIPQSLEEGEDGYVWLSDVVAQDRINHTMCGTFWLGGIEYAYEVESGDRNGWVWRSVSADGAIPELDRTTITYALAPRQDLLVKAADAKSARFLLVKWDALLKREAIASIPRKYGYDRHFSPGTVTESYWRKEADKYGFQITTSEEAAEMRSRLEVSQ